MTTLNPMHRMLYLICMATLCLGMQSAAAQTPEMPAGATEGWGVEVQPRQRDLVIASNADAFLYSEAYPRVDIVVDTADLSCFRLLETYDYDASNAVTLDVTWCMNEETGLVSATSRSTVFGQNIVIQGAFCGWKSVLDERITDEIVCTTMIQESECGPIWNRCINEIHIRVFRADGAWADVDESVMDYAYDASKPYPLSGE